MRRFVAFAVAWWAIGAQAGIENPFVLPVGERETATANAGVAGLRPSAGAVLFNPANLQLMHNSSVSVSGSAYVYNTIDVTPFVTIDNTPINYDASGFDTIPSSVVSVSKGADWCFAFSVLVPEQFRIENRLSLPTPNTSSTLVQLQQGQELWAGPSISRSFGPDLSLGVSLFGVRASYSSSIGVFTRFPANPNLAVISQSHLRASVYSLTALIGARYHAASFLDLGLRIRVPGLLLMGSGDGYNFEQTIQGANVVVSELEQKNIAARISMPLDVSLGTGWSLMPSFRILADFSIQSGVTFDSLPGSAFSDLKKFSTRGRVSLGTEVDLSDTLELAGGFMWNPGTRDELDLKDGDVKQDFYVVTLGGSWRDDRVRTGLILFHAWSDGNYKSSNPTPSEFTMRTFGASLVFSYALGERATPPTEAPPPPAPLASNRGS